MKKPSPVVLLCAAVLAAAVVQFLPSRSVKGDAGAALSGEPLLPNVPDFKNPPSTTLPGDAAPGARAATILSDADLPELLKEISDAREEVSRLPEIAELKAAGKDQEVRLRVEELLREKPGIREKIELVEEFSKRRRTPDKRTRF